MYKQGNIDGSIKYAIEAVLRKGKLENKWRLFKHLGDLFRVKNNKKLAGLHYEVVKKIREQQGWNPNPDIEKWVSQYNNGQDLSLLDTLKELKCHWEEIKYGGLDKKNGEITNMLPHGKAGS